MQRWNETVILFVYRKVLRLALIPQIVFNVPYGVLMGAIASADIESDAKIEAVVL